MNDFEKALKQHVEFCMRKFYVTEKEAIRLAVEESFTACLELMAVGSCKSVGILNAIDKAFKDEDEATLKSNHMLSDGLRSSVKICRQIFNTVSASLINFVYDDDMATKH